MVIKMKKILALVLCLALCFGLCACADGDVQIPALTLQPKAVPDSPALAFTRAMGIGWNLGNTFDATGGSWIKDELDIETAWHGVKTTEALIEAIHSAGFDTLRVPVSWHDHVDADFNISARWLDRVQEVITWAYSRGMYVIVNIHHDCEKAYYYPTYDCLDNSTAYVRAIWTQLAARFQDYDEHLIFENLNEPRLKGTEFEWSSNYSRPEVAEAVDCINRLNQVMVDAVRQGGGCNETRYIMLSGYTASPSGALTEGFKLPDDTLENHLIISTHAYTPYEFALQDPKSQGSTAKWSHEDFNSTFPISSTMESLYKRYVSQGIPVVMGEFGSRAKGDNLSARVDHAAYYVLSAAIRGIPCVWWDNNAVKGNGELFGLINRRNCQWIYPEIRDAMLQYKLH